MLDELLLQAVSREIERYCIDKGCAEWPEVQPFIMPDVVQAFGMARYIANEAGCTHYVVAAPNGHSSGYWFTQFRCKVMEVYTAGSSDCIQAIDDLSCIAKRRVTIVVDSVTTNESLQSIVQTLQQHRPAEIWLFIGGPGKTLIRKEVPNEISQVFVSEEIYNFSSQEQLDRDFTAFFARLIPRPANKCAVNQPVPVNSYGEYNIGKTLKPLFRKFLELSDDDWPEENPMIAKNTPNCRSMALESLADNETFRYYMTSIFKPCSFSFVSVQPGLAVPLSLMLLLKYSRGWRRAGTIQNSLFISLTNSVDLAERLMAYCMRRNIAHILRGEIATQDWPKLTKAASSVCKLGIDFWQEDVFFDTDRLRRIIQVPDQRFGLIVIYDSTGQLFDESHNKADPEIRLEQLRTLASEFGIPIILVCTNLRKGLLEAEIFDHVALLKNDLDRCELLIGPPGNENHDKQFFNLSQVHNILEDDLVNFTSDKPDNYEIMSIPR